MTIETGQANGSGGRRAPLVVLAALAASLAALCLWSAAPAQGWEGINAFSMTPSSSQAGGHPDVEIVMNWDNSEIRDGQSAPPSNPCVCDDARILTQHFPTGFIGNPHATPICENLEFAFGRCPPGSQVGVLKAIDAYFPLFNITPHPDEPSLTAAWFPLVSAPVFITLGARTESDYGLYAESAPMFHPLPIFELGAVLWGVPADPANDSARFVPPLKEFGVCFAPYPNPCPGGTGTSADVPPIPYLQSPTTCGVPLKSKLEIEYYTGVVHTAEDSWPATTGCEQLTFNPSLSAQPTTRQADSPSGVDIELRVPQELSPTTPSPSQIRSVTTTLPEGFSINPNAADGKVTCSDAETGIGTRLAARCPEFAKVGTLTLDSSALPQPIPGAIYLAEPEPGDRYRLLLAADGFGTHVKLPGSVRTDPGTGRLQVTFQELPQSPLTAFEMHFFGAERGLLATPSHCGTYPVRSEFVPWNDALPTQTSLSEFTVDAGPDGRPCPQGARPFAPSLAAGNDNTTAGSHSPFTLEIRREDGDQELRTITVKGPPGFAATLRGVPYCPEAALAETASPAYSGIAEQLAPRCPAASQIGTSTAGAGAGSRQVYLPGKVYLAGPYGGAPLSLVVVTPAVSGPYDLGNVVVRAALHVDPATARVTAVSDPIPRIVEGIPLRVRTIRVNLDRPGFTYNPTSCDPFAVESAIGGAEGGLAGPAAPFQVANCASLSYAPRFALQLRGKMRRGGHPAIRAVLRTSAREANTRRVSVTLPKSGLLDNSHIETICTRVAFAADACPPGSRIGSATAVTPLLDQPLRGDVYLRASSNKLPDMVVDLEGQIDIEVASRIDSVRGRLRATFETIPDAPVTRFVLNLQGGRKGLFQNSRNLCRSPQRARLRMRGHNGMRVARAIRIRTSCGSKASRHGRHARSKGGGR